MRKPKFLYPSQIFWNEEDEGYIALAPDLSGCSAFGESPETALAELQHAIEAWIAAANSAGNPVPPPSRPSVEPQPSGKVLLRMPRDLHATLLRNAQHQATSLNQYAVHLLTAGVTAQAMTDRFEWISALTGAAPVMTTTDRVYLTDPSLQAPNLQVRASTSDLPRNPWGACHG